MMCRENNIVCVYVVICFSVWDFSDSEGPQSRGAAEAAAGGEDL